MRTDEDFRRLLVEAVGEGNAPTVVSALNAPASVSVRLNPAKAEGVALPILDDAVKVPWCDDGFILSGRPVFTLHPLFHSGVYYVHDSSSMFVGWMFGELLKNFPSPAGPLRVLDLCAAPGGKTTHLASILRSNFGDRFILVANEVMRSRATVLADNVARWGDPNVVVTSADPAAFAHMEGFFDIILTDVPCSGEGMFRKDENAVEQWSLDNVALCASRQRRILGDVWPALNGGGTLIYSTCTFNSQEDDGNVEWICDELGAVASPKMELTVCGPLRTRMGYLLAPGLVPGEGQFCAAVEKRGEPRRIRLEKAPKSDPAGESVRCLFSVDVSVRRRSDLLVAVPSVIADEVRTVESVVGTIAAGCAAGRFKGRDFVPDADLALCTAFRRGSFPEFALDRESALAFLHRDPVVVPGAPAGIVLLTYKNVPLGFVKNLGSRTNSLHPQSRRIRMDI